MARKAAGLTAKRVKDEKTPGRYGDGGGLYLLVRSATAKFWLVRYKLPGGKAREMGLGGADWDGKKGGTTLAQARDKATDLSRMVNAGIDPLVHREQQEAATAALAQAAAVRTKTFNEAAEEYMNAHREAWKNEKHRDQWAMTLKIYAGPHLGSLRVADIDTPQVEAALRPI